MRTQFEEIAPKNGSETEVFVYDAPKNASSLGTVAIIIDTSTLPDALQYFGALISGTFRRSYYAGGKNMQRSFTAALRAINDALAEEARSGTGQWIGMLHALIAASDGQSIILSTAGGIEANIARSGNLIELPLEAGDGIRPFGSYTSGAIYGGDVLLATRKGAIDGHGLREIFTDHPAKIIKQTKRAGISALVMTTTTAKELRATDTKKSHSSPNTSVYKSAWRQILRGLRALIAITLRASASIFRRASSLAVPLITKLPSTKTVVAKVRTRTTRQQSMPSSEASVESLEKSDIQPSSSPKVFSAWIKLRQLISKTPKPNIPMPGSKSIRIAASAAILLVLAGGITFISSRNQKNTENGQMAAALADAASALERGETQIILGDTSAAIAAFTQGLNAIDGLPRGGALRKELSQRRNSLAGIRSANIETGLSFAGFPVGIDATFLTTTSAAEGSSEVQVALAGESHPAVWLNSEISPSGGTFFVLPLSFTSGIKALTAWNASQYVVATREGIAILDSTNRNLVSSYAEESATSFSMLAAAEGSGFVLTDKYTIESITYDSGIEATGLALTPWLTRADKRLSAAKDMIVLSDGPSVLLDDNTFLQFRLGRNAIQYTIEGFDWDGTATAFTPLGDKYILVLDTKYGRILLTETNGDIIEQYEIPGSEAGRDIVAIDTTKVLLLTDSELLRIELPKLASEPEV